MLEKIDLYYGCNEHKQIHQPFTILLRKQNELIDQRHVFTDESRLRFECFLIWKNPDNKSRSFPSVQKGLTHSTSIFFQYLDAQITKYLNKPVKTEAEIEREESLLQQRCCLSEERHFVLVSSHHFNLCIFTVNQTNMFVNVTF